MRISVVIPTYEFNGHGISLLDKQFDIFKSQTFKDFQVVISDHSKNNDIEEYCSVNKFNLDIKYIRNDKDRGNFTANTNCGIKNSDGEIIKILYQDDFLYDAESLRRTSDVFGENINWAVSPCVHTSDGRTFSPVFTPRYNDKIHEGINTISCPSVLSIRNLEGIPLFDERLLWLMDVDYYKALFDKFGLPAIMKDVTVCVRQWENQLSKIISDDVKNHEHYLVLEKYKLLN
jgi:glycosyltransferase involved in cell wall biosynthesis